MNIIDLDKTLYIDPRHFLRFAYLDVKKKDKKFKDLEDSDWDNASYWNEIIDLAIEEKAYFKNASTFVRGEREIQLRGFVNLLDEENNVVVEVPLGGGFMFRKDGKYYMSFGPFIVAAELRKFKTKSTDDSSVNSSSVDELEYLEV